jgi:hypothetical protein
MVRGLQTLWSERRSVASVWLREWIPVWSVPAGMRAVRAAVVVAGLFAFTDKVIGNLQMATFGGFATLVLASFGGTRRNKLLAHLCLAVVGSELVTIGTAVHSPPALAAILERPEVVIMRPLAKCGGCGARIYPDRITHRDDPTESAPQIKSGQLAHAERSGPGKRQKHPS